MNKVLYRGLFAAALVATAANKLSVSSTGEFDLSGSVKAVLARQGAILREDPLARSDIARSMLFDVPGCDGALQVVPVNLGLEESALFDTVIRKDYARRFVYLEKVWFDVDRLGMRAEWMKHKVFSIFGFGQYVTVSTALLVAEPPGCDAAEKIDWPSVWDRSSAQHAYPTSP
jgi:hypothetical protein